MSYCDFNSHAFRRARVPHDDYVQHLLSDHGCRRRWAQGRGKDHFIGGGTRSLLSGPAMQTLLDGVRARLNLAADAEVP